MAHTTVPTKNPGDLLGSTDWNTYIRDNDAFNFNGKAAVAIARDNGGAYSTSSSTFVDVDGTNLSITINSATGRAWVTFHGTLYSNGDVSALGRLDVTVDGTRIGGTDGLATQFWTTAAAHMQIHHPVLGLTPGSHTFKLQWKIGGGAAYMFASAGQPAYFSVVEF